MTAYGAVISLKNTIDYVLRSSHFTLADPSRKIIQPVYNELQPLQQTLEELDKTSPSRSRKKVNALDGRIKDLIREFEDLLESHVLSQQILSRSVDLQLLQDKVSPFIDILKDMMREYIHELRNMPEDDEASSSVIGFRGTNSKIVGSSDLFKEVKEKLIVKFARINVLGLVGMAGIGKTTLAEKIYQDPEILECFKHRAWVTVGRKPQPSQLLQGVVAQLAGATQEYDRYLIVLDDIWDSEILDDFLSSLQILQEPVDRYINILLITRDRSSIENIPHLLELSFIPEKRMLNSKYLVVPFLSEEESKKLLCHKVFGEEMCPTQLDKAATKIAKKCEGLPLMIVTVAGFISNSHSREDPDYWNEIAEEKNSVFTDAYNEIAVVLFPSYDYLPQFLKMPFLYMGVFHPDYDAPPSKIINMLMAEGWLVNTNKRKPFEEYAWECLDELCVYKYLVLFKLKSTLLNAETSHRRRKFKTCRLHSTWRHVCRGEAPKNKFYQVLKRLVDGSEEVVKGQRCLCLQNNILFGIKEVYDSVRLNCASSTRSLLFYGPYHQYQIPMDIGFRLLRELDALNQRFYCFPEEILALVQLKYLALTCNGEIPATISELVNLQVLIIHPHMRIRCCRAPSYIPIQIWDMQELGHIEILGKCLVAPHHAASLEKLLTLVGVNATICTILKLSTRIPNIRKLGVQIELMPNEDNSDLLSCFGCISTLGSLETLKCSIVNPVIQYGHAAPNSLMLPRALKKLHLSGTGFPWGYMDAIGALPFLQVLKLRSYAFRGTKWEVQGDSFQNLEFLLIEDTDLVEWIPRSGSFRMLSYLSMKHCYKFLEIYWPALSMLGRIELVDCNPPVLTRAKEIHPIRRVHLDIIATSTVDKEPVTATFRSYWEPEKEPLDMGGLVLKSVEVVPQDIPFPSQFVIMSIIVIFCWLLKLRILHYFGFC